MNTLVEDQIRATVEARLRELAPVAAEIQQLQHVLDSLPSHSPEAEARRPEMTVMTAPQDMATATSGATTTAPGVVAVVAPVADAPAASAPRATQDSPRLVPVPRPHRLGSRRGSDGRAPQGANKQRILATIAAHPGLAAPEIASLTGLKRPVVASTISRLKRTGELCAHGHGVRLADFPADAPTVTPSVYTGLRSA